MNNSKLEYVENYKHLGVTIYNDLTDDKDMLKYNVPFMPGLIVSLKIFTTGYYEKTKTMVFKYLMLMEI